MTQDDSWARMLTDEEIASRPKVDTRAWLVWRQGESGPEFYGVLSSQQDADQDAAFLNSRRPGWRVIGLWMIGQGWDDRIREFVAFDARFRQWQIENGIEPQSDA
jgi:hypothetical protein